MWAATEKTGVDRGGGGRRQWRRRWWRWRRRATEAEAEEVGRGGAVATLNSVAKERRGRGDKISGVSWSGLGFHGFNGPFFILKPSSLLIFFPFQLNIDKKGVALPLALTSRRPPRHLSGGVSPRLTVRRLSGGISPHLTALITMLDNLSEYLEGHRRNLQFAQIFVLQKKSIYTMIFTIFIPLHKMWIC